MLKGRRIMQTREELLRAMQSGNAGRSALNMRNEKAQQSNRVAHFNRLKKEEKKRQILTANPRISLCQTLKAAKKQRSRRMKAKISRRKRLTLWNTEQSLPLMRT